MDENLIKITPNIEKAKSISRMAETTLEMIKSLDLNKFSSHITKEYYDVIRELMSIVLLLDGYRTYGEGAHKKLIEYIEKNYEEFNSYEISVIDDLRIVRNKIAYDGFFVDKDYIERRIKDLRSIIKKLKEVIRKKLSTNHSITNL